MKITMTKTYMTWSDLMNSNKKTPDDESGGEKYDFMLLAKRVRSSLIKNSYFISIAGGHENDKNY